MILLDPKIAKSTSIGELEPGDLVYWVAHATFAIVCGRRSRTHVLLWPSRGTLVSSGEQPIPDDTLLVQRKPALRVRLLSKAVASPSFANSPGMIGIDSGGPFVAARHDNTSADVIFAIGLDDFVQEVDNNPQNRSGGRVEYCRNWFAEWRLVHVDEFGKEMTVFEAPFAQSTHE